MIIIFEYPEEMSGEFQALLDDGDPVRQVVCDYIACMTDRFAVAKYIGAFYSAGMDDSMKG